MSRLLPMRSSKSNNRLPSTTNPHRQRKQNLRKRSSVPSLIAAASAVCSPTRAPRSLGFAVEALIQARPSPKTTIPATNNRFLRHIRTVFWGLSMGYYDLMRMGLTVAASLTTGEVACTTMTIGARNDQLVKPILRIFLSLSLRVATFDGNGIDGSSVCTPRGPYSRTPLENCQEAGWSCSW